MTQEHLTIDTTDGLQFDAYVSRPSAAADAPVVVVIQEIFGINKVVRGVADWLASKGYIAVAPDLFHRIEKGIQLTDQTEGEWQRAFELYNAFDENKGVQDLIDTVKACRALQGSNGKVGDVGFCLGGKLAYLMSTRSDTDASVGYYGVSIENNLDEEVQRPLLLHIAEADEYVPAEAQEKIKAKLTANPKAKFYTYAGMNHAFTREGGKHYHKESAELAHQRTLEFFKSHIG